MKLSVNMLMLLLLSSFFFSCKKDQLNPGEEEIVNSFPLNKVLAWLDAEKSKAHADSAKFVEVLKQNLLGEEISEEKLNNVQRLVIIPLKNEYKTTNSTELPTFKKLVVTIVNGEILSGNIVELIPKSEKRSNVNLSGLFNNNLSDYNGIVSNLSVFGKFKSEEVYKDGKLYSRTELSKKERTKKKNGGGINTRENYSYVTCYDWFITTTFFNRDGSILFQTREYIGYSCTGLPPPCELNRIITRTKSYFRSCGSGGGGGTGGGGGDNTGEDACVTACASNTSQLSDGATISSETEGYIITGINGFKKYKNPKWYPLKNLTWNLISQEEGIVELVDPATNKWVWNSLVHKSISFRGISPGGTVTPSQGTGKPSFVAGTPNVLYAGMELDFDVTYAPICDCPTIQVFITPYSKHYTATSEFWNAIP